MITDMIVGAMDTMIEMCNDPIQKQGMLSLREMLCDLDEDQWYQFSSAEEREWLSQFFVQDSELSRKKENMDSVHNLIDAMSKYGMENNWTDTEVLDALVQVGVSQDDFNKAGYASSVKEYFAEQSDDMESLSVDFRPGYYSWDVYVDGEIRFSFEISSENFEGMDSDDLENYIKELINGMQEELQESGKTILTYDEAIFLQDIMFDALAHEYDIPTFLVVRDLNELQAYIERNGWSVCHCDFAHDHVGWEISRFTPADEDFFFEIEHDNDVRKAVSAIQQFVSAFKKNHLVILENGSSDDPIEQSLADDSAAIYMLLKNLADGVKVRDEKRVVEHTTKSSLQDKINSASDRSGASQKTTDNVRNSEVVL